jgi:IS1 family transposase
MCAVRRLGKHRPENGRSPAAMALGETCPHGGSIRHKNADHTRYAKPNHPCQACERPCVARAEDRDIGREQRIMMRHLRRECTSQRGMCRAAGASLTWLLHGGVERVAVCPNDRHARIPRHPTEGVRRRRAAEADEMGSVVQQTAHRQWSSIAMEAQTRQVMAFHVGDRSRDRATALSAKMPSAYREHATFPTDPYDAYTGVMPAELHQAITTPARQTHHFERVNNTLRQRVARLCTTRGRAPNS